MTSEVPQARTAPRATIVLLVGNGPSGCIFYHRLRQAIPDVSIHAIFEQPVPARDLIRRRWQKLGPRKTTGQLFFIAYSRIVLEPAGRTRFAQIVHDNGLDLTEIPSHAVSRVPSVNSAECHTLLATLAPQVVVLAGTRILTKATLRVTPATFINMHAGVTPAYRGVHGAYWALADGRTDLVGTTIHRVDEGIDTGQVIEQRFIAPTAADSFTTYPMLQVAAGLPALVDAVKATLAGFASTREGAAHPSSLRSHPTLWEYAKARALRGVR